MPSKTGKGNSKKKRNTKRKIIISIVLVAAAIVLICVAFVMSKLNKLDKISFSLGDIKTNDLNDATKKAMKGYTTLALFGLDNRSNGNFESGNSDTMIVASINNETGEIKMASVYRDSYLDIGDGTFKKANAAYNTGGPKQAINMLNQNLDLNISDYVSVDFNALVEVIDQLGGIEIDVTEEEAANLAGYIEEVEELSGKSGGPVSAGTQTLNGVQATAYARIRYTTGWDFKRTERQRTVISKIFEKAKQADLLTLNSVLDTVFPDISTSLSVGEMLSLAKNAGKYTMGESTGFPFEYVSVDNGPLKYMVVPKDHQANVVKLHEFLYTNESYTPSAQLQELSTTIHNNTGY